jgi:hypothetical protein
MRGGKWDTNSAGMHLSAHAQFSITEQRRSVLAEAKAQDVEQQLEYPTVCHYPNGACNPLGYIYPRVGNQDSQSLVSAPGDMGPLVQTTSAQSSYKNISARANIESTTTLGQDAISVNAQGSATHTGPNYSNQMGGPVVSSYQSGGPYARSVTSDSVTFQLDQPTQVEVSWAFKRNGAPSLIQFTSVSLWSANAFNLTSEDSTVGRIAEYSGIHSLAAGVYHFNVTAGHGVTSFNGITESADWSVSAMVRAVPEASTWSYMLLGLLGTGWAARRQRQG